MFGIVRLIGGVVLLLAVGALAFMSYQAGFAGGVAQAGAGAIPGDAYIPAGGGLGGGGGGSDSFLQSLRRFSSYSSRLACFAS